MKERFARYLLGEMRWELSQSDVSVPELRQTPLEQMKVLAFSGYDSLRVRAGSTIFDVRLSWCRDVPLTIERLTGAGD